MANEYFLDWTDNAAKSVATDNPDPRVVLLPRSTNSTSTPLTLYGKGAPYYGEGLQENLLRMVEHFYSTQSPSSGLSTPGQIWFDATDNLLKVYSPILDSNNAPTGACEWTQITTNKLLIQNGQTSSRPIDPIIGEMYFDTDVGKLLYWSGVEWLVISDTNTPSVTPPTDPIPGDIWYDSVNNTLSYWNNSTWNVIANQSSVNGSITDINNSLALKVNKSGDTMSGFLTLHATPTNIMHAATKGFVDTSITNVINYVNGVNTTNTTALNAKVNKSGDILSGFLTLHANPVNSMHAATKGFVDVLIAELRSYIDQQIIDTITLLSGGGIMTTGSIYVKKVDGTATIDNQTVFTITNDITLSLDSGDTLIFIDGVKLNQSEVVIANNVLTLPEPLPVNTNVSSMHFIVGGGLNTPSITGSLSDVRHYESLATAGQTVLTVPAPFVTGNNSLLLFINGVKQIVDIAYVETNDTTITLSNALAAGDNISIIITDLVAPAEIYRQVVNATTGQYALTLTTPYYYTSSHTDPLREFAVVYVDGIKQSNVSFSEVNGTSIVLSEPLVQDTNVEIYVYKITKAVVGDVSSSNGSIYIKNLEYTANTGGQSTFQITTNTSINMDNTNTMVFVGGVKQLQNATTVAGQSITTPSSLNVGSQITAQHFIYGGGLNPPSTAGISATHFGSVTATAGQTAVTTPSAYVLGSNNLLVFVDGVKQVLGTSYTETGVNTITFSTGLQVGAIVDMVVIDVMGTGAIQYETFTPIATQSVFTLNTPYHHTTNSSDYNNAAIAVYVQGVRQNYVVENSGTSITLSQGVTAGKVVEIYVYNIV